MKMYGLAEAAAQEFKDSNLERMTNDKSAFSLHQLQDLYQGIMVQDVYRQWLVPQYQDPASVVEILLQVHVGLQLRFVPDHPITKIQSVEARLASAMQHSGMQLLSDDSVGMEMASAAVSKSAEVDNMLSLVVQGLQMSLHGPNTFVSCHKLNLQANVAVIKEIVTNMVAAMTDGKEGEYRTADDAVTEGTTLLVVIPSSTQVIEGSTMGPKIVLVENRGALDGITITIPSIELTLRRASEVVADARAVQIRIDGLAAKNILEKHYDNIVRTRTAWHALKSAVEKLEQGTFDKTDANEQKALLDAIQDVSDSEVKKGEATLTNDGELKLDRVAVLAGSITAKGRMTREGHPDPWLFLFTEGNVPVWQSHGSLCSPKPILAILDKMLDAEEGEDGKDRPIGAWRKQVGKTVSKRATAMRQRVIDAAVDYHDIDFSNCTLLAYAAKTSLGDLADGIAVSCCCCDC